jgi:hypothetical protein
MKTIRNKLLLSGGSALAVAGTVIGLDVAFLRFDHPLAHQAIAGAFAGLVTMILTLALQLRHEEQHYLFAAERAAVLAEVNHHVRNAIFPLCVAVERSGESDGSRLVTECVERINLALREASVDAAIGRFARTRPGLKVQKTAA